MTKEQFENDFKIYSKTLGKWIGLYGNIDVSKDENRDKLYNFYKSL